MTADHSVASLRPSLSNAGVSSDQEPHGLDSPLNRYTAAPAAQTFPRSVLEDNEVNVSLTPTQPTTAVERRTVRFWPKRHLYWIKVLDMEPIIHSPKATQIIRDTYIGKLVYLESSGPLEENQIVHATWATLVTWHKTSV